MSDQTVDRASTDMHTISVAAMTPMVQSILTGILLSIFALALALTFELPKPWHWMLWGFLIPTVGLWLISVRRWFALTNIVQRIEQTARIDIDGDGVIGLPPVVEDAPKKITVTVRDVQDNGHLSVMNYELPANDAQLTAFAEGVTNGVSLAEANWTGAANPFSKSEYHAFRGELIRRRWVTPSNPNSSFHGFEMTRVGRVVMREIAKMEAPHSPTDEYVA